MSYWNYRIVQKPDIVLLEDYHGLSYEIHEIYYDKNGDMTHMTEQGVSFRAANVKELAKMMLEALEKPVIKWDEKLEKPVEILLK